MIESSPQSAVLQSTVFILLSEWRTTFAQASAVEESERQFYSAQSGAWSIRPQSDFRLPTSAIRHPTSAISSDIRKMYYFGLMRIGILIVFVWLTTPLTAQFIELTEDGYEIMRVYYGGGSFFLDEMQRKSLQEWLSTKEKLKEYEILVQSHTDNIGSHDYNLYLSQMRSESVIEALNEINIAREEIRIQDFGEEDPLFDNKILQGRLNNRRVDIILIPPSS